MESEKELREIMTAYPHKLNKYIHDDARDKLISLAPAKKSIIEKKVKPKIEDSVVFKEMKKEYNMTELRYMAKEKGLSGYSNLKEDDLIKLILSEQEKY